MSLSGVVDGLVLELDTMPGVTCRIARGEFIVPALRQASIAEVRHTIDVAIVAARKPVSSAARARNSELTGILGPQPNHSGRNDQVPTTLQTSHIAALTLTRFR